MKKLTHRRTAASSGYQIKRATTTEKTKWAKNGPKAERSTQNSARSEKSPLTAACKRAKTTKKTTPIT